MSNNMQIISRKGSQASKSLSLYVKTNNPAR